MTSFKSLLKEEKAIIIGPVDFWLTFFKKYQPQSVIIHCDSKTNLEEIFQPTLFNFNQTSSTYILSGINKFNEQQLKFISKTDDQIFLLDEKLDQRKHKIIDGIKTLHLKELSFERLKITYLQEILKFFNRKLDSHLLQTLSLQFGTYADAINCLTILDLYVGEEEISEHSLKKFEHQVHQINEFALCEKILMGRISEAVDDFTRSENINVHALNALLNKLAYTSLLAQKRPQSLPEWLQRKAVRSKLASRILKLTMELEEILKSSAIEEKSGFLTLLFSLEKFSH